MIAPACFVISAAQATSERIENALCISNRFRCASRQRRAARLRAARAALQRAASGLVFSMKTLKLALGMAVVSIVGIGVAAADPLAAAVTGKDKDATGGKPVFVTGSRIPKRVQVKAIGTNTTSPLRVYTRAEIDRTGRFTTEGILAQDPSVTIIGNGSH